VNTPFSSILEDVVKASPNAIGGAFAASDGEMVDAFSTMNATDFAIITAHYGVVMALLKSAFGTWHFGWPEYFYAQFKMLDVIVHEVDAGYFALVAYSSPPEIGNALEHVKVACTRLKKEMM
jgi:predicted regulator of Ras-like GTPase activity (Roadblock/LC7/MglB family)